MIIANPIKQKLFREAFLFYKVDLIIKKWFEDKFEAQTENRRILEKYLPEVFLEVVNYENKEVLKIKLRTQQNTFRTFLKLFSLEIQENVLENLKQKGIVAKDTTAKVEIQDLK